MQNNTPYRPTAVEFMEMWRYLNFMAHTSGVVHDALSRHGNNGSDWLHYYLFRNNFEVLGQSLLEYCLREMLDIAATDKFSDFDLTGYALEPELECPKGDEGAVRQALMDEDVFQLLSLYSGAEAKQKLDAFIKAQGSLKVLVLPGMEAENAFEMLQHIEQVLADTELQGEYIMLMGRATPHNEIGWGYRIYTNDEFSDMQVMVELPDEQNGIGN